jgi:hypothetical protein
MHKLYAKSKVEKKATNIRKQRPSLQIVGSNQIKVTNKWNNSHS